MSGRAMSGARVRASRAPIEFAGFAAGLTIEMDRISFITVNFVSFADLAKLSWKNNVFARGYVGSHEFIIGPYISLTFPVVLPDRATEMICEIQDVTPVPRRAIVKSANKVACPDGQPSRRVFRL